MLDMEDIKRELKADLKPRKIVRAALIPQFKGITAPLRDVFGIFVRVIAQMFTQAKLIDADHPANTGLIKGPGAIWQMIVDGSARLEFKREKAGQLMIFYCVVGMIVFSILSVITIAANLGVNKSHAQTTQIFSEPSTTISSQFLATMFPYSTPGGNGLASILGSMLLTYNTGILVLASVLALWSLISMITDSAHHGQWGGQRHSALYAPIRLVFAIGLLTPLGASMSNFNTAQVLTVLVAEAGSGLANTVWDTFVDQLMTAASVTPIPPQTDINKNLTMLYSIAECQAEATRQAGISGSPPPTTTTTNPAIAVVANSTAVNGGTKDTTPTIQSYTLTFNATTANDGYCGSVTIPAFNTGTLATNNSCIGTVCQDAWVNGVGGNGGFMNLYNTILADPAIQAAAAQVDNTSGATNTSDVVSPLPTFTTSDTAYQSGMNAVATAIAGAVDNPTQQQADLTSMQKQGKDQGWVTAGSVFMKFANMSSSLYNAQSQNYTVTPPVSQLSATKNSESATYHPARSMGECSENWNVPYYCTAAGVKVQQAIEMLNQGVQSAQASAALPQIGADGSDVSNSGAGSSFVSKMNSMGFGQIREAIDEYGAGSAAPDANSQGFGKPLIWLVSVGNVILEIDAAAMVIVTASGLLPGSSGFRDIVLPILLYLYAIGVTFCVLIPLLPAIRFFVGTLTWLLTIFEALLGLPVVALWHLRSEGEGLLAHGKEGYLLLLQMMLRPVLMIFGLIGAVLAFDTISNLLYVSTVGVWWNLPGVFSVMGPGELLSFFGFLGAYTSLMYVAANLCFNLVNTIPDRILLWIGSAGIQGTNAGAEGADSGAMAAMNMARNNITGPLATKSGGQIMRARLASQAANAGGGGLGVQGDGGRDQGGDGGDDGSSTTPAIEGPGGGRGSPGTSMANNNHIPASLSQGAGGNLDSGFISGLAPAATGGNIGGNGGSGNPNNDSISASAPAAANSNTGTGAASAPGGGKSLDNGSISGAAALAGAAAAGGTLAKGSNTSSNANLIPAGNQGAAMPPAGAGSSSANRNFDPLGGAQLSGNGNQAAIEMKQAALASTSKDLAANDRDQKAFAQEQKIRAWEQSVASAAGINSPMFQPNSLSKLQADQKKEELEKEKERLDRQKKKQEAELADLQAKAAQANANQGGDDRSKPDQNPEKTETQNEDNVSKDQQKIEDTSKEAVQDIDDTSKKAEQEIEDKQQQANSGTDDRNERGQIGQWRPIGADEILQPGYDIRANLTTGINEVFIPKEE